MSITEEERWRLRARLRGYIAAIAVAVFVFRLVALPLSVVLWVVYRWRRLGVPDYLKRFEEAKAHFTRKGMDVDKFLAETDVDDLLPNSQERRGAYREGDHWINPPPNEPTPEDEPSDCA